MASVAGAHQKQKTQKGNVSDRTEHTHTHKIVFIGHFIFIVIRWTILIMTVCCRLVFLFDFIRLAKQFWATK